VDIDIEHVNVLNPPPTGSLLMRRHRNFFAMIFGPDGKLLVGRDVLIHDPDASPASTSGAQGDNRGDRTGLFVEQADDYYLNDDPADGDKQAAIDPTGGGGGLFDLLVEANNVSANPVSTQIALNFRSVDGLLVYDDSILRDIPADVTNGPDGKRGYLLREGLPIYVSRLTGEVIEGPKGESQ
jgi:hypothetical protein